MIRLSREIRFSLAPPPSETRNSWAGWPTCSRVVPFLTMRCVVAGKPDPVTGYLCDIKEIDRLLRTIVVAHLIPAYPQSHATYEAMLRRVYQLADQSWNQPSPIAELSLHASPFHYYQINSKASDMVTMTQQFEFSAAHRLHSPELSDAENESLYGKCNNPNGHGHNYVVEVSVAKAIAPASNDTIDLHQFQETVNRLVIDRLDHKNLNEDIPYFASVLPSVENIAIAIWDWLDGNFQQAKLVNVRVYETPKTWAEYSG